MAEKIITYKYLNKCHPTQNNAREAMNNTNESSFPRTDTCIGKEGTYEKHPDVI